jgi:hypothetical protein
MEYQYYMENYIPWNTVFYRILIPIQYNTGKSVSVEYNTANSVFRSPLVATVCILCVAAPLAKGFIRSFPPVTWQSEFKYERTALTTGLAHRTTGVHTRLATIVGHMLSHFQLA